MISVAMLSSWTCILHVHERKNWNIFVISKILPGFIIWLESYVSDTFVIMSKLFTDFLVKIWMQINIYTLKDKESAVMWVCSCCSGFTKTSDYDPQHRNPLYCRADAECIWELQKLSQHFHPTVSLFASNLLKVWLQEWGYLQQILYWQCKKKNIIQTFVIKDDCWFFIKCTFKTLLDKFFSCMNRYIVHVVYLIWM